MVHNCGGDKLGGRYKDLDAEGGKYQRHHMPANDASPLSLTNGPAILMDPKHHQKTASWGRAASAVKYRAQQAVLIAKGRFDDAVQMDIDDIQRLFGDAYDEHILQMIDSLD